LTKDQVAKYLESYANSKENGNLECFKDFSTFDTAIKAGYPGVINEEETIKVYCDSLSASKAIMSNQNKAFHEILAESLISSVENLGPWISNVNRRWLFFFMKFKL